MKSNSKKKTFRRNLLEWLLTLTVCAGSLYFFAPPSWWRFGEKELSETEAQEIEKWLNNLEENNQHIKKLDKRIEQA